MKLKELAAVIAAVMGLNSSVMAITTTVIVTSPQGVLTNPNQDLPNPAQTTTYVSDPLVYDAWRRQEVANKGSIGITGDYPRSGDGSVWFSAPSEAGGYTSPGVEIEVTSKAGIEYLTSDVTGQTLGNLTTLTYDFYRSSTSFATGGLWQHPTLSVYYDADGSLATTGDRGSLIYERAYQPAYDAPGPGFPPLAVPTDQWITDATVDGRFWRTQFGNASGDLGLGNGYTLAEWMTGITHFGMPALSADSVIFGVKSGYGRGDVPFYGAVDNITLGFGSAATRWNFELTDTTAVGTPEPVTPVLLAMAGLMLLNRFGGRGSPIRRVAVPVRR